MKQYRIFYKKNGINFSKLVNAKSLHEVYDKYQDVDIVKVVYVQPAPSEIDTTGLEDDDED